MRTVCRSARNDVVLDGYGSCRLWGGDRGGRVLDYVFVEVTVCAVEQDE